MKTLSFFEKLSRMGMSTHEMQNQITMYEVASCWDFLVTRYDIMEETNILENFVKDEDLKLILQKGSDLLRQQIKILERLLQDFGIPMPIRPPVEATSALQVEVITDRYIFRRLFSGIQGILPVEVCAISRAMSNSIRNLYRSFLENELDILDLLYEYGKQKTYLNEVPVYRS